MKIYTEQILQGMIKPCFFIYEYDKSHTKQLGNMYKENHSFSINYILDESNTHNERLRDIAEQLFEILELVKHEEITFNSINMNYKIDDNILIFLFDINTKVIKKQERVTKQQKLEVKTNVKEKHDS